MCLGEGRWLVGNSPWENGGGISGMTRTLLHILRASSYGFYPLDPNFVLADPWLNTLFSPAPSGTLVGGHCVRGRSLLDRD